ncbi:hypothetical protein [Streptococcus sp. sy018]|uniref:hypothetical protein n=1 Tax=Streptococcus sp. sy018 TaxID=2600147 RepID=UPI0011B82AB9|nr:hypothetical protein [Streptococcus sp. sy018]TWS95313.1 hypothetical protein FRX52_00480 [Streptococcus sp. sy018]
MNKEEMKSFARLDEAVDRLAEGCNTLPIVDMPKYNIRAIMQEAMRLGRPLTDSEVERFIVET